MSENLKVANSILSDLDTKVVPKVKENGHIVQTFLKELEGTFKEPNHNKEFDFHIMHAGSAYESLAVEEKVDFDITLSLQGPYASENFDINRDSTGYYKLKWKSNVQDKRMADSEDNLQSSKLRKSTFKYLRQRVEKINLAGEQINCYDADSSFSITIKSETGRKIKVDLVPQIACRTWGQCKDLKPLRDMPSCLRRHIDTLNKNKSPVMFFSLGIPNAENYKNADQLFNVSFSMLEKNYFKENPEIRDMVRLAKYTGKQHDWNKMKDRQNTKIKFPFKSFHAKRVAIKYHDKLKGKDVFEGCKDLLCYTSEEIKNGTIDGYFVKKQVMKEWKPEEIQMFQKEVNNIRKMDAEHIFKGNSVHHKKAGTGKMNSDNKFHKDFTSHKKNLDTEQNKMKGKFQENSKSQKIDVNGHNNKQISGKNTSPGGQTKNTSTGGQARLLANTSQFNTSTSNHTNDRQEFRKNCNPKMNMHSKLPNNDQDMQTNSTVKRNTNATNEFPVNRAHQNNISDGKYIKANQGLKGPCTSEKHTLSVGYTQTKYVSRCSSTSAKNTYNSGQVNTKQAHQFPSTSAKNIYTSDHANVKQGPPFPSPAAKNTYASRHTYAQKESPGPSTSAKNTYTSGHTNAKQGPQCPSTSAKNTYNRGYANARQGSQGSSASVNNTFTTGHVNARQAPQGSSTSAKNTYTRGHTNAKQGPQGPSTPAKNTYTSGYANARQAPQGSSRPANNTFTRGHASAKQGSEGPSTSTKNTFTRGHSNAKQGPQGPSTPANNTYTSGHAIARQGAQGTNTRPKNTNQTHSKQGFKGPSTSSRNTSSTRHTNTRQTFKQNSAAPKGSHRRKF